MYFCGEFLPTYKMLTLPRWMPCSNLYIEVTQAIYVTGNIRSTTKRLGDRRTAKRTSALRTRTKKTKQKKNRKGVIK